MAVATTYPGVYIEEIPSGVHTITGVSTSITAFVGYTARGDVDGAVHIFSFADFERAFGGLSVDSPLSYCVRDFFLNGGTEAYVVRAAANALAATVTLGTPTLTPTLEVAAATEGTWGNNLQIDVDYGTANAASLFNLTATEYVIRNGEQVPARSETFRNLSMDDQNPAYAVEVINAGSALIQVTRLGTAPFTAAGTSTSGVLTLADAAVVAPFTVPYTLNGVGPFEATIVSLTPPNSGALNDVLDALAGDIATAITNQQNPGVTGNVAASNDRMAFVAVVDGAHPNEHSSIHFLDNAITARLHLGINNGGTEVDGAATARPAQTGTVGVPTFPIGVAVGNLTFDVMIGAAGAPAATTPLDLWGTSTTGAVPTTVAEAAAAINTAITAALPAQPLLAGAFAQAFGNMVRIVPGPANPNISFRLTAGTASVPLGLSGGAGRNVGHYAPSFVVPALAQLAGSPGNNGSPPLAADLIGNAAAKTGMYALENVDLFNLLVIPEASTSNGMMNVLTEAIAYCTRRRAFMIIDAPVNVANFAQAQAWISGPASPLRSRNAALYFPRLRAPDPLRGGVVQNFAAAGALAGVYARTDSERGVWKAPAGTATLLVGPTGLSYTLTDPENGTLNPLGLNCLRTFRVIGNVAWGARTGRGADALADEYKYIPVRRLALFLEESLYRGTQWVVFEPNDEPLWAQIRLNLGAFMHTLYALGAFQGTSPRDAYFVRCDKETTTQNDIDLGRVNIIVGFAPLKPAEFVIIQIQQKAGAIQT
jgi:Bacteriophage tail sheath protein